jgi:hypothetical protein
LEVFNKFAYLVCSKRDTPTMPLPTILTSIIENNSSSPSTFISSAFKGSLCRMNGGG